MALITCTCLTHANPNGQQVVEFLYHNKITGDLIFSTVGKPASKRRIGNEWHRFNKA